MVKYASKAEKSSQTFIETFKSVMNHSKEEDNPKSKLRSLMLKFSCGQRDIGQSEVCRLLMSGQLYQSSFYYVNQSLELNSKQIEIDTKKGDDQICFKKTLLDYFLIRKSLNQKMDNVYNLIDFCQAFQFVNKQFKLRKNSEKIVVITHPKIRYNPLDLANHRSFCYYQLIKYSSWDQSNIHEILNKETSIQRFDTFIKLAPGRVIFSLNFFNEFLNELKRIRVEIDAEPIPEYISTDFTELSDLVPITEIIDNSSPIIDLNYDWKQRRSFYKKEYLDIIKIWVESQKRKYKELNNTSCHIVLPEKLNKMQRFAFNIVEKLMLEEKQLCMILIDTAGTGKSFTIFALSTLLQKTLRRCAPTAKAAFIINGETIHNSEYKKLSNAKLCVLQEEFKFVKFLIIDEYSMLSQKIFGLSIILVGDPGQLLPVCGSPLYATNGRGSLSIDGHNAYKKFDTVVMLEKVERQTNTTGDLRQSKFIKLLPRCRNGENTVEDWKLLLENSVNLINIQNFSDGTRLYLENEKVDKYNNEKLTELNMPIINFIAHNSSGAARKLKSDQFAGLSNSIYCSINSKICLTSNIWTSTGLVNSAGGTIKNIIVSEDYKPGDLPEATKRRIKIKSVKR
ncbi:ATP-dependent DNA helicase PIF1 [Brachionus plicatilis]|uniref:ATP-dependent DNA helicase PIF1 n=1 Tax=Brachionus plicatilis TaxID=10195 RepID=A0A3M7RLD4_BRAPC|nr:ATP-dependent DNA helicase PIF1 [Brachionus plicatilis]